MNSVAVFYWSSAVGLLTVTEHTCLSVREDTMSWNYNLVQQQYSELSKYVAFERLGWRSHKMG